MCFVGPGSAAHRTGRCFASPGALHRVRDTRFLCRLIKPPRRPCESRHPYSVTARFEAAAVASFFLITTAGGYGSLLSQGRQCYVAGTMTVVVSENAFR